jgi:RimJ/RimL family protein N-acetyltransferase
VDAFSSWQFGLGELPQIEGWFDDPETQRWLGGRDWPRHLLELAQAPDRFAVLFGRPGGPVALLDLDCSEDGTAAIALVVAPAHRRRGIATTVLQSLFSLAETRSVVEIIGEVEVGNVASERLVRAAGFSFDARTEQGFDRFAIRRTA